MLVTCSTTQLALTYGSALARWGAVHRFCTAALALFPAVVALEGGAAGGDYFVFVDSLDEVAQTGF